MGLRWISRTTIAGDDRNMTVKTEDEIREFRVKILDSKKQPRWMS